MTGNLAHVRAVLGVLADAIPDVETASVNWAHFSDQLHVVVLDPHARRSAAHRLGLDRTEVSGPFKSPQVWHSGTYADQAISIVGPADDLDLAVRAS